MGAAALAAAGEASPFASADGTQLHAEVFGPDDAPTFVLIPGWTEELQIFDLLTRGLLGRGFRVVGYDPRGQGASGLHRGLDQSIERYAEDLTAVLVATLRRARRRDRRRALDGRDVARRLGGEVDVRPACRPSR